METRFQYKGTGAGMFGNLFVGVLLCLITLGIYTPWFVTKMYKYIIENTVMKTDAGEVRLDFRGRGAELFGIMFVGCLLCLVTLGIYYSWFVTSVAKFLAQNVVGRDGDGREYTGAYNGTGGGLFGVLFVGVLLTIVTLGIYCPWFLIKATKYFTENTAIMHNGAPIGSFGFAGNGGTLFGKFLVGTILTVITIGIYWAWFTVDLMKFFAEHSTVTVQGVTHKFKFTGTGAQLFVIGLVGGILTFLTLGIYGFWYLTNQIRFKTENIVAVRQG